VKHVVALSGGKDSTAMALRLREVQPEEYVYLITPVGNELPEMHDHWRKLEHLLQAPLTRLQPYGDIDGLRHLIEAQSALPSFRARWCTRLLKIVPTIKWLTENAPCVQYVGLRADEEMREGIYGDMPAVKQSYPLRDWGWTAEDVWGYLEDRGVTVPNRTDCAWCYGQRLGEWKTLLERYPSIYERAVEIERKYGHTFRSPGRDTWPASLDDLRNEFRSGRKLRGENCNERCRVCRM